MLIQSYIQKFKPPRPGSFISILSVLLALAFTALTNPAYSSPISSQILPQALPDPPAGLKNYFMVGLANQPGDFAWMTSSGVPWDARYQYLAGGVNTPGNWKTWQWDQLPPGQFALDYMTASANNAYLPVFSWYQLLQSSPSSGSSEPDKDFNNLNNASTMNAYFADFKLLMDKAKTFGKPVVIHVEPDLWGYLQKRSANPNNITAAVASSGYGDVVAGYPNTVAGFAKALVALRTKYAPNALLAYHISPWASSYGDLSSNSSTSFNVSGAAQETANFYLQTGANFDLMFYDIADRDAALYQSWGDPTRWWDTSNSTFPNFNRFHQFVAYITASTGKRGVLWQVPLGNTVYRTMNNTDYHWQDNKAQYYLNSSSQHIQDAVDSGLIGIMFGSGGNTATINTDHGDGITNPAPINGNNLVSSYTDDDGGYIRVQAAAYYSRGPVTFGNPTFNATPSPGSIINISTTVGNPASTIISLNNTAGGGPALTISAPTLSGAAASSFSVAPAGAFNLAAGASAATVTIQCNPTGRGTFNATLSYTTNDTAHPEVSYQLVCTGVGPHFSSTPYQPDATISMAGQVNQPVSITLEIGNAGDPGTNLAVNAIMLNQAAPGTFTATPIAAFTLAQGAPDRVITVTCTPSQAGVNYTAVLTFPITNDPALSSANYNLVCKGLTPLIVTSPNESGPGLTLPAALNTYTSGQNIITFAVAGNQITLAGTTSLVINRGPVVIDGGSCSNGQPAITINGSGGTGNGISIGNGVELRNIGIKNFGNSLVAATPGASKLGNCLVITKA